MNYGVSLSKLFLNRCIKDAIEEVIFFQRKDLFTELDLVFFDTTSIYFEDKGVQGLSQKGFSKDRRPDLKQMIVCVFIDNQGQPICCQMWPGTYTQVREETNPPKIVRPLSQKFQMAFQLLFKF